MNEWELQYGMNNYKQRGAKKGKELFITNYEIKPNSSLGTKSGGEKITPNSNLATMSIDGTNIYENDLAPLQRASRAFILDIVKKQ